MDWNFDIDARELTRESDKTPIRRFPVAYPDKYPVKVTVTRGTTPFEFSGSIRVAVKPTSFVGARTLASLSMEVEEGSVGTGTLNLATEAMRDFVRASGERPTVLEVLVIDEEGNEVSSAIVSAPCSHRVSGTDDVVVDLPDSKATQNEALAGTSNSKWMTPLRVFQVLTAWASENLTWASVQAKPTVFPPAEHTHGYPFAISIVAGAAPGTYVFSGLDEETSKPSYTATIGGDPYVLAWVPVDGGYWKLTAGNGAALFYTKPGVDLFSGTWTEHEFAAGSGQPFLLSGQ